MKKKKTQRNRAGQMREVNIGEEIGRDVIRREIEEKGRE